MCKCYNDKVASNGCAKENPVRIRNDTVTVNGELLWSPLGNREGKAAENQVRRTALSWNPRFAVYEPVFSITIQNIFSCIAQRIEAAADSRRFFCTYQCSGNT